MLGTGSVMSKQYRQQILEIMKADRLLEEKNNSKQERLRDSNEKTLIWLTALNDAASNKGTLNIAWKKLDCISPIIYDFSNDFKGLSLVALRLIGTNLTSLPNDIGLHLKSLEILSLSSNYISKLPETIIKLTNLVELNLIKNKLEELPHNIGQLTKLEKLLLSNNLLRSVPKSFGNLNKLKNADLESNHISHLPDTLGSNMTSCISFNINCNRLSRLPRSIGYMPNLTSLSAILNSISYIPEDLGNCISLKVLRLSSNKINFIPEPLGELTNLTELCLDHNKLAILPSSFYQLSRLRVLRLDSNPELDDPSDIILNQGAEAVVDYCRIKFKDDELYRMRTIIISTINVLRQIEERKLYDSSIFRSDVIDENGDNWFAFQKNDFWNNLLPTLKAIWEEEILSIGNNDGDTINSKLSNSSSSLVSLLNGSKKKRNTERDKNWIISFPYTEIEVNGAFSNFVDAYGLLVKREKVMFVRCSCEDIHANKSPCIPPKIGFMCQRVSILFKSRIVSNKEKSERSWREHKRKGILDAVNKAKADAKDYLNSLAGKEFLNTASFAKAEELLQENSLDIAVQLRNHVAENMKSKVIKKYDKLMSTFKKSRDKNIKDIEIELDQLRTDEAKLKEGYMKKTMNTRINELLYQLANMNETIEIQKLQNLCEKECDQIDDEIFFDDDSDDDNDDVYFGNDDDYKLPDQNDMSVDAELIRRKIKKRDKRKEILLQASLNEAVNAKVSLNADSKSIKSSHDELNKQWKLNGGLKFRKKFTTLDATKLIIDNISSFVSEAWKLTEPQRRSIVRKARRTLLHAIDVSEMRVRRLLLKLNGKFDEVQKELWHELHYQYINYSVFQAKQKSEMEFNLIDEVRRYWDGSGLEIVFNAWKTFTKSKQDRLVRDQITEYHTGVKNLESTLASVDIAQLQINEWEEYTDIYSEKSFWKNRITGKITIDKPSLEHYLPPVFEIPKPPKEIPEEVKLLSLAIAKRSYLSSTESNPKKMTLKGLKELALIGNTVNPNNASFGEKLDAAEAIPDRANHLQLSNDRYVDMDNGDVDRNNFYESLSTNDLSMINLRDSDSNITAKKDIAKVTDILPLNYKSNITRIIQSSHKNTAFKYGPDTLSISRYPERFRLRMTDYELLSRSSEKVDESKLESQAETARNFRSNQINQIDSFPGDRNASVPALTFIQDVDKSNLSDISQQLSLGIESEIFKSNKNIRQRHTELINPIQRQTYLQELYKLKNGKDDKEIARLHLQKSLEDNRKKLHSLASPDEVELLKLAGGNIAMSRISGTEGLKLRSVIATRALHIKDTLKSKAIELGVVKAKKKSMYEREIAPIFRENYSSSDDDMT